MRSVLPVAVLAVALVTAAPTMNAQTVVDAAGPRAGSWGAEATYGGSSAVTLLRFSSPSAAWLIGVGFNAARQTDDRNTFPGTITTESSFSGFGDVRIGRRWWRGNPGDRLRPLTSIGIIGNLASFPSVRRWNAGGYGELGATYFLSPYISLGASGELSLSYGQERLSGLGGSGDLVDRFWVARGNLARLSAGVYF